MKAFRKPGPLFALENARAKQSSPAPFFSTDGVACIESAALVRDEFLLRSSLSRVLSYLGRELKLLLFYNLEKACNAHSR